MGLFIIAHETKQSIKNECLGSKPTILIAEMISKSLEKF